MKPSEREIEMRKESLKREAQKAGGLLPGEKVLVKDELDRVVVRV